MAGRAHKKLLQQQLGGDLPLAAESSEESDEESGSEDDIPEKAPFNPFALLTDSEGGDKDEEEDEPSSPEAPPPPPPPKAAAGSGSKKKKAAVAKKKKTASKGKARASGDGDDSEGSEVGAAVVGAADEAELDAILAEMNLQPSTSASAGQPAAAAGAAAGGGRPLLAVDMRQLKADEELKRMFGSRVVEEDDDEGGGGAFAGASRRVRRLAARGLLRRQALKPGAIITPRDTWARFDGGFTMEAQGVTKEGKQQFGYVYSQTYQAVQDLYEECQATFDPNNIAALLHTHPYHLDALITMQDLYRSMGEQAYAEEMLERGLYALEMAWHPSFSPAAANMHVPYEEANAPLFICLFRYMQGLSRCGLHRTALEVCKLLLALNADDPLGALATIDYFALRAGRYDFLYRLAEQYGGDGSAALLPNFVFSQALARWYQEQEGSTSSKARGSSSGGGGGGGDAGASSSGGGGGEQRPSSADLLTKAVLLYPEAVVRLQRNLQGKGVGKDAEWATVLRRPLFAQASDGGSASLAHLLDIWVERQHLLWKAQPIQNWLLAACRRAAEGDTLDLPDDLTAADWACVREQAFPSSAENEYGHLRLHDFSDAVARLPPEEIHGMAGAAGAQEADVAALEAEMRVLAQQMQAAPDLTDEQMQQMNPLAALLRSLLPWVNLGQAPAGEEGGEGADGAVGGQQQQPPGAG